MQKNARPAKHDVAIEVSPPARGRDIRRPMVVDKESCTDQKSISKVGIPRDFTLYLTTTEQNTNLLSSIYNLN